MVAHQAHRSRLTHRRKRNTVGAAAVPHPETWPMTEVARRRDDGSEDPVRRIDTYRWQSPRTGIVYEASLVVRRVTDSLHLRAILPGDHGIYYVGTDARLTHDGEQDSFKALQRSVEAFEAAVLEAGGAGAWIAARKAEWQKHAKTEKALMEASRKHAKRAEAREIASRPLRARYLEARDAPGFAFGVGGSSTWKTRGNAWDHRGERSTVQGRSGTTYTILRHHDRGADEFRATITASMPGRGDINVPIFSPTPHSEWGGYDSIGESIRLFEWEMGAPHAHRSVNVPQLKAHTPTSRSLPAQTDNRQAAFKFNGRSQSAPPIGRVTRISEELRDALKRAGWRFKSGETSRGPSDAPDYEHKMWFESRDGGSLYLILSPNAFD